jgi:hypothetical protein
MLRLKSIGILEQVWETAWGLPGFVCPKKDGTVGTIKDLRKLNKYATYSRSLPAPASY